MRVIFFAIDLLIILGLVYIVYTSYLAGKEVRKKENETSNFHNDASAGPVDSRDERESD